MQLTFNYRTKNDVFGLERGGFELMDLTLSDVGFLDDVFPSISHAHSTMELPIAGDIGGPSTVMDNGSSPMVVDDCGSGTSIYVSVKKSG